MCLNKVTMVMKMLLGCLVSLLLILGKAAESRTLHADSCSFNVHTHELRKYYSDVRSHAVSL